MKRNFFKVKEKHIVDENSVCIWVKERKKKSEEEEKRRNKSENGENK